MQPIMSVANVLYLIGGMVQNWVSTHNTEFHLNSLKEGTDKHIRNE
jgi:hypothetical protein